MNTPITANNAVIPAVWKFCVKSVIVTSVESEFCTSPAFCKPMKAINKPIPKIIVSSAYHQKVMVFRP